MSDALVLEGVHKSFGRNEVLRGIDLTVGEHDVVCVRKSPTTVLFVQSPGKDYFQVLRKKLKWGE